MTAHVKSIPATADNADIALGTPLQRLEDERLLTGQGRYVDDIALTNVAHAYVVRSPYAHARIRRLDATAARAAPGVLAVLTGADVVADGVGTLRCPTFPEQKPGSKAFCPSQPILVTDKVRHVGDYVALVVAETLAQAKDAGELLEVDYEALPAVTLVDAVDPGAPQIWDGADGNVSFVLQSGDKAAVDRKFAEAAHVTTLKVHYARASANSMEPRATVGFLDPSDGRYTLCSSTQMPFQVRETLAEVLHIPQLNLRVKASDVGGGFGMKGQIYPEDVLIVWAAGRLKRPVKWTAERSEGLASDTHGRSIINDAELAFDRDGKILAFRTDIVIDLGAYLSVSAGVPPRNAWVSYPGTYHVPLIHAHVRAVFTNSSPIGPYRGSGKPEASFVLDRLMEKAAHEMGVDPIDLRRRNFIRPDQMPYKTPGVYVYDNGNFEAVLDKALAIADLPGFAARRAESEARGVRRGIGLSMHCQRAGIYNERMEVRMDTAGAVAIYAGTFATGQGHETMFAQMVAGWIGVPVTSIRVFQGDTDRVLFGRGTFGQRSMGSGGSALKLATEDMVAKGRRFAAWMLEASEDDIVFDRGIFRVTGTDREVGWKQIVARAYAGGGIPPELGVGLDGVGSHPGPNTYPNGCMVCEVEVDIDTGRIKVERLTAVDDVGVIVNPLTVEGQLHGSFAQGLGETLQEEVVYERGSGQLLSGSFMDYAMPRADIMPHIESDFVLVPTKTNLLGTKGGAEAGNAGGPSAIVNAALNALADLGITELPMPATPERVWRAIQAARGAKPASS